MSALKDELVSILPKSTNPEISQSKMHQVQCFQRRFHQGEVP